jgi:hypothetical protein
MCKTSDALKLDELANAKCRFYSRPITGIPQVKQDKTVFVRKIFTASRRKTFCAGSGNYFTPLLFVYKRHTF